MDVQASPGAIYWVRNRSLDIGFTEGSVDEISDNDVWVRYSQVPTSDDELYVDAAYPFAISVHTKNHNIMRLIFY